MTQIIIEKKELKHLIKKEVLGIHKNLIDKDSYFSLKEKKEFLQSLKEYKNGEKFSLKDIEKGRKLNV